MTPAGVLGRNVSEHGRLAPLASRAWLVERAAVQARLAALNDAEGQLQQAAVRNWVHSH